jgi:hypothetical protein
LSACPHRHFCIVRGTPARSSPFIRSCFIAKHGGNPENGDCLTPTHERSLKRALKALVDRGDVLIVGGAGGPGDPYRYTTVESFAGVAHGKKKVKDTAHAKQIVAELNDVATKSIIRMRSASKRS